MKLDDNPQMVAMLDHTKGSLENKIRQAYNSGYNDGFKAGMFEAWDDMRKQLGKSLRQQFEQRSCDTCKNKDIEGWKNPCLGCIGFAFYEPKDEPFDKDINVRSKDEPQNIELSKVKSELNEWRDIIGDDVVDDIISNLEEKADEDEP